MKLLHIDASIQGDQSVSRDLSELIVKRLTESDPGAEVIYRDLTHANLPHLTIASLPTAHPRAAAAGPLDAAEQAVRATSDAILSEFLAADTIVIGAPMYNFTIPSQLKAWIDRIIVPGTTFQYGANGQEGLAGSKRVIVALARGGLYGPGSAHVSAEHAESYLRAILGYIGITRLEFVVAEGLLLGEELKKNAVADANDSVRRLAA